MLNKLKKISSCGVISACLIHGHAFAESVGFSGSTVSITWPWTKFINSVVEEVTGPLPVSIGIIAIALLFIGLVTGHAGGSTQKVIAVVIGIAIVFFAPTIVSAIESSAGGLTILAGAIQP